MLKNAIWLFAIATIILIFFLPSFTIMQDQRQKILKDEHDITVLKEKNSKLEEEKKLLEGDPVYLERVARERMGLVREGETVVHLKAGNEAK